MSMEEELQKWAENLTALEGRHAVHLRKRLEELAEEAADIQQKLLLATSSNERLESYRPIIDAKPICPWCWIQDGVHSTMRYVSSRSDVIDIARCNTCNKDCLQQRVDDDGSFS
jgi:hypothetical protein